jgi:hypothetical protein
MIEITKSPKADSRSSTYRTKDELEQATISHIHDVQQAVAFLTQKMNDQAQNHDHTKLEHMDDFYAALNSNVKESQWYHLHTHEERHHLNAFVHDDVTLVDIVECACDCTMAGLARSG